MARNRNLTEALVAHMADRLAMGGELSEYDEYTIDWRTRDTPSGDWLQTVVMPHAEDIAAARKIYAHQTQKNSSR